MGKQFAQIGETPEMDNTEGKALNYIINKFIKIYYSNEKEVWLWLEKPTNNFYCKCRQKIPILKYLQDMKKTA